MEENQKGFKGKFLNVDPKKEKQLEMFPVSDGDGLSGDKISATVGDDTSHTSGDKSDTQDRLAQTVRTVYRTTGNIQHHGLAVTSDGDAVSLLSHLTEEPHESLYTISRRVRK